MTAGAQFEREILEQAEVTRGQLAGSREAVRGAAAAIAERPPAGFLIAARGTSDHAATYAKYLLELRCRAVVSLAAPSAFSLYRQPPRVGRFCVIGISQSGASVDICSVVEEGRRQGALTIAVTNQPASRLGQAADLVLPLGAGEERSVPASKTYTATLCLLAMLSQALTPDAGFAAGLERVPDAIQEVLAAHGGDVVGRLAEALEGPRLAVLGRGFHLATAQEIALKIMETSYGVAEARSIADFQHGPLAIIEPGFPVLLLEASGPALQQMQDLAEQLRGLGARVVEITDQPSSGGPFAWALRLGLPEPLTPIPFAVAGQLLALEIARRRGYDPDRPRSLHKVTITR